MNSEPFQSITEMIGNTPMIRIRKLLKPRSADVYAKLEWFNIGGSVKDRTALSLIETAEAAGVLRKGKTIIEATSGNTGIALAMLGAAKGYGVTIVMSEGASIERRKLISAYGADLVLTPVSKGTAGAIEQKERLIRENPGKFVSLDQFHDPANPYVHFNTTAREILRQMNWKIDAMVMTIGTGGTSTGIALRLREALPSVKIIGVTPKVGVRIDGIRNPAEPNPSRNVRLDLMDEVIEIDDIQKAMCFETGRRAAREEGLLLGMSSACALHVSLDVAAKIGRGKNVVTLFPDNGLKYLSTELFEDLGHAP
ncbi:MAG: PLP-dependent cysteine synthase family protein [Thermoplasmataceae archaeon]|jgi:cysteine synthase A|nr:MAG: PLP-dependent cysteine synthase family protein [Cuniculiplasma divulgatum]